MRISLQPKLMLSAVLVSLASMLVAVLIPIRFFTLSLERENRDQLRDMDQKITRSWQFFERELNGSGQKLLSSDEFQAALKDDDPYALQTLLRDFQEKNKIVSLRLLQTEQVTQMQGLVPLTDKVPKLVYGVIGSETGYLGVVVPLPGKGISSDSVGGILLGFPYQQVDENLMSKFAEESQVRCILIPADNKTFADSLAPSTRQTVFEELRSWYEPVLLLPHEGIAYQAIMKPVENQWGKHAGTILLLLPRPVAAQAWGNLRIYFVVSVAIGIAVALVAGYFLARSITKPLRELVRGARAIAAGHFERRVQRVHQDEVGDLARSFNFMAEKLQEMKALEEQMRRQERLAALGQLSAGVAHEIRNPLGIIKGSAEVLKTRFGGQPGEDGFCDFIIEEVKRLSRVVSDFLSFARPQDPLLAEVNLVEVVRHTLELALQQQDSSRWQFESKLPEEAIPVMADREQCHQVLLNLLLNATEAMPEGGTVRCRVREVPAAGEVVVEVADTGAGIPPETKARIFDPFFTTKEHGTGLGLSIVHRIVEAHHARIEVESELGKGTIFRITFPTARANLSGG